MCMETGVCEGGRVSGKRELSKCERVEMSRVLSDR
jgi:hypothetical protein